MSSRLCHLSLACALCVFTAGRAAASTLAARAASVGWQPVGIDRELVVERKPVSGTGLWEVRVSTRTSLAPPQIAAVIWNYRSLPRVMPYLQSVRLVREEPDARYVYEQITPPWLGARDITVKMTKKIDAETQAHALELVAANDAGPPENQGHVRLKVLRSVWTMTPSAEGTLVIFQLFSDPAAGLPHWLVNNGQVDSAKEAVRAVLKMAGEKLTSLR